MKQFIFVFALCLSAACFAEAFSAQKAVQLRKSSAVNLRTYCYNAQVSNETNPQHLVQYFNYYRFNLRKFLTKDQIDTMIKKFEGKFNPQMFQLRKLQIYSQFGLKNDVLPYVDKYSNSQKELMLSNLCVAYTDQKNYEEALNILKLGVNSIAFVSFAKKADIKYKSQLFEHGKQMLTSSGGIENPTKANEIVIAMFRYKPASITKQQQVAFIEQLAQIYPIPGTDFNTWKSFMGFIGYKYKALTGKDLFPEAK